MRGVARLILALSLPVATPAAARQTSHPPAAGTDPVDPAFADALTLALGEVDLRMTVPVTVDGKGPFPFVIDTGAERSVVSRELAERLGLKADKPVNLTTMTGTSRVPTVVAPALTIGNTGVAHRVVAPALFARDLGAAGLLGIDTLRDHRVAIDFARNTMAVVPSSRRTARERRDADEIVVTAKSLFGQLIVTDAMYGDTRIQVVLDTGSQITLGNDALRRRVGRQARDAAPVELISVTGGRASAAYTRVPAIRVGRIKFGAMPIGFAQVKPFERFGLVRRPGLLLGMDALRAFARVEIDFPNRQVRFVMPRGAGRARRPPGF